MATNDTELKGEIRVQTGYTGMHALDSDDLDAVLSITRRHITAEADVGVNWSEADWYTTRFRENALFWWACLFTLTSVGELDRNTLQIGAVDAKSLLAKENNDVTSWYRRATESLDTLMAEEDVSGVGITAPTREDRLYDYSDNTRGSATSTGSGNDTSVSGSDL